MKKTFLIIFLVLFLAPVVVQSAVCNSCQPGILEKALVPCGRSCYLTDEGPEVCDPCQLCHIFVLFDNIINFLWPVTLVLAILMIVVAGMMFVFGGGNPKTLNNARELLKATGLGLLMVFGAWIIVNTLMMFAGVATWTGLNGGWWSIPCSITP